MCIETGRDVAAGEAVVVSVTDEASSRRTARAQPEKRPAAHFLQEQYLIMDDLSKARLQMVEHQIAARGIRNPALLDVMRKVPREFFVPPHLAEFAYLDTPLPIESGQTISQPTTSRAGHSHCPRPIR